MAMKQKFDGPSCNPVYWRDWKKLPSDEWFIPKRFINLSTLKRRIKAKIYNYLVDDIIKNIGRE